MALIALHSGISLYGIPPDTDIDEFRSYGFEPSLSWIAYPTLVKVRRTIATSEYTHGDHQFMSM